VEAQEGDTKLTLKKLVPVRLLDNPFYQQVLHYETQGASPDDFKNLLGKGRAKKGMFEGDIKDGELEIGQVSALIDTIKPVHEIMDELISGFNATVENLRRI